MPIARVSRLLLAQTLVQSTVSNRILVLVLQHTLFNFCREKWVTWCLAVRLSKGRVQSSCRQLSGGLERPEAEDTNARHSKEEISTFHQKDSRWMACDKSCYWVISDIQELAAMVQTDCMHSLFTSNFLLFISDKRSHFQDFESRTKVFFFC